VTDRRLLIQPLNWRGNTEGDPRSITHEQVDSVKAGPAGGEWINVDTAILDYAAVRMELRTTDGEELRLMLMRAEGKLLGKLGGDEPQRQGLEALAAWLRGVQSS
jgi:hypothetical protein